nr:hypothetical protein [Tanacetum cinerariifolium]
CYMMVPIHHSSDKVVIGATTLSLALSVQKIKDNIVNQRSAHHDVFVPLSEPLSVVALTDTVTSDVVSATGGATMALSTTLLLPV